MRRVRGRRGRDPGAALVALRYEVRATRSTSPRHGHRHAATLIPMLRVQHVDTTRGPLDQLLGLAVVVVQHGGREDDDPRPRSAYAGRLRDQVAVLARTADDLWSLRGRDHGARARGAPRAALSIVVLLGFSITAASTPIAPAQHALPGHRRRRRHADRPASRLGQRTYGGSTSTGSTPRPASSARATTRPAEPDPEPRTVAGPVQRLFGVGRALRPVRPADGPQGEIVLERPRPAGGRAPPRRGGAEQPALGRGRRGAPPVIERRFRRRDLGSSPRLTGGPTSGSSFCPCSRPPPSGCSAT